MSWSLSARSADHAFIDLLGLVMKSGESVPARQGVFTKELTAVTVTIENPKERVICVPHRNNNIFAAIAETLWVLRGRNDLKFLSQYLPRAVDFSDDGFVWRGGYGPRLRNWNTVDQVGQVIRILSRGPLSRRAVMSIFDPDRDFIDSKDIPCNNWIQFLHRNGSLDMHIAQRSCDILWGFSAINTFEWSVLHELVASCLSMDVGKVSWFIGSAHVYDYHFNRIEKILKAFENFATIYTFTTKNSQFTNINSISDFDSKLSTVFNYESVLDTTLQQGIEDSFLQDCVYTLWIYKNLGKPNFYDQLESVLDKITSQDFSLAALEYICRPSVSKRYPIPAGSGLTVEEYQQVFLEQFEK